MESRVISIDFFRYWVLPIRIFSTENLRIRRNWPFFKGLFIRNLSQDKPNTNLQR